MIQCRYTNMVGGTGRQEEKAKERRSDRRLFFFLSPFTFFSSLEADVAFSRREVMAAVCAPAAPLRPPPPPALLPPSHPIHAPIFFSREHMKWLFPQSEWNSSQDRRTLKKIPPLRSTLSVSVGRIGSYLRFWVLRDPLSLNSCIDEFSDSLTPPPLIVKVVRING